MSKPFLKWMGGKSRLVDFFKEQFPKKDYKLFVEPFAGSASVSLGMDFPAYWLNDINPDLINLYKRVINNPDDFIEEAKVFFQPDSNNADFYYNVRDTFNTFRDRYDLLRALHFLYLNKHCFNGLIRYNRKGMFNAAFGKHKNPSLPEKEIREFASKFKNSLITNEHFSDVLESVEKQSSNVLVYCDPPYVTISNSSKTAWYTKDGFSMEEQKHLVEFAENSKHDYVISNHDTEETRDLYKNASRIIELEVGRRLAGDVKGRKPAKELLVIYEK